MADNAKRLREARERTGKSPEQVAKEAGLNFPSYCDLESNDDEIYSAASLREVFQIAKSVGLTFSELMTGENLRAAKIAPSDLQQQLRHKIEQSGLSEAQFESRVGWAISDFLKDEKAIAQWNVDALRAICAEVGVDWLGLNLE